MFVCKFCNKTFKTEKGLLKHNCPTKSRYDSIDGITLHLYKLYMTISNTKLPNDEEKIKMGFAKSKTIFDGFSNFKQFAVNVDIPNVSEFFKFVSVFKVPMKLWTSTTMYKRFMDWYITNESETYAIVRSKTFIQNNGVNLNTITPVYLFNLLLYGRISKKYLNSISYDAKKVLDSGLIKELGVLI